MKGYPALESAKVRTGGRRINKPNGDETVKVIMSKNQGGTTS